MLNDIFNRLEAQEKAFAGTRVLAPVIAGRSVAAKIAGVICHLEIEADASKTRGFSVLEAVSSQRAKWLRAATKIERERYLALFPKLRFVALQKARGGWLAVLASDYGAHFRLDGPVLVREIEVGIQLFDPIWVRFDGAHFWFESLDTRRPPAIAAYLRESLASEIAPQNLHKKGLSSFERTAYSLALYGSPPEPELALPEAAPTPIFAPNPTIWDGRGDGIEARLARSVAHGGAQLVGFVERGDVYSVTYKWGDRTHTSTVRAGDLGVETSGICLSGRDGDFDLTSLVGVMQEASRREPWQFEDDY